MSQRSGCSRHLRACLECGFALGVACWVGVACTSVVPTRPTPDAADEPTSHVSPRPSGTLAGARREYAPELPAASASRPVLRDRGVFEELSPRITTVVPAWLAPEVLYTWRAAGSELSFVTWAGVPVGLGELQQPPLLDASPVPPDADTDGIPDAFDILLGAKKAQLNAASYKSAYHVLPYPGGDVPRDEGVCSDVVIRALRNAGFDLQQLVHEDILRHPSRYPHVPQPDPHIDHRRVRVLLPWFVHHWQQLPSERREAAAPYLPGDVVFFDTLRGPEPDHIGIVSDTLANSGQPAVINNWTDGTVTSAMDLLGSVRVTHRFRVPTAALPVAQAHWGLEGVLLRHGLRLPADTRQAVLVTSVSWGASTAQLRRYQRADETAAFEAVGEPVVVRLGARGLGRGRGLHSASALGAIGDKREGDRRAPAGVFDLGTAFGPPAAQVPSRWPWRVVGAGDVFVDDPESPAYNQWQPGSAARAWRSAERLSMYELGLLVMHNSAPVVPGAGSAIFLHTSDLERPTAGCTAMQRPALEALIRWLSPDAHPRLVQVADHVFGK